MKKGHPKGKSNRYHSKDFKISVVQEVLNGRSSKEVGEKYGINDRLIRQWTSLYLEGGEEALENKRKPGNPLCKYSSKKILSEIEQLRYELAKAEIELAKLKKVWEQERRCRLPKG